MNKISKLFLSIAIVLASCSAFSGIKVATYNIRTFDVKNSYTNKVELKKNLTKLKADLITVEEIVNAVSFKSFIAKEFKNYDVYLSTCGGAGNQKIGFVYRKDKLILKKIVEDHRLSVPKEAISKKGCGRLRPALIGTFAEKKTRKEFIVIGLHLKAGGRASSYERRAKQYDVIETIVDELRSKKHKDILLMGDMNTTGFLAMDQDYTNFKNLLRGTGTSTSSTNLGCTAYWMGTNRTDNVEESSVLDHILYPPKFLGYKTSKVELHSFCKQVQCKYTSSAELGTSYKEVSDHCPVSMTFR
jgi:endonuclease/exonuclease/phosphatase family metal-dependent hydrolase